MALNAQKHKSATGAINYSVGNYYCAPITEQEWEELATQFKAYEIRPNTQILHISASEQVTLAKYAQRVIDTHASMNYPNTIDSVQSRIAQLERQIQDLKSDERALIELHAIVDAVSTQTA